MKASGGPKTLLAQRIPQTTTANIAARHANPNERNAHAKGKLSKPKWNKSHDSDWLVTYAKV
jgi:hypothetical protein